ncbi:MAG: hypothetical protein J6W64_08375 [Bacilli bacterium]|nr:hypothetical protein [Bacilli bacterium]MBO7536101.1 hypothetical protein [Bacilli bacterium]
MGVKDIPEVTAAFSACYKAGNTTNLRAQIEKLKTVLYDAKIEGKDLAK